MIARMSFRGVIPGSIKRIAGKKNSIVQPSEHLSLFFKQTNDSKYIYPEQNQ